MSETIKMDFYVAKRLIRELNAKELKKAWKKHLKEQESKNAEQGKQRPLLGGTDKVRNP